MSSTAAVKDYGVQSYLPDMGKRTLVMGILNFTPDSFSDGGRYFDTDKALDHAREMVELGADIIDIGAESTRPGHTPLSAIEEWHRLEPILARLRETVSVPISIDTYKSSVAQKALDYGADMINDVWGGRFDAEMFKVLAKYQAPYILMHNATDRQCIEGDIITAVMEELLYQANLAMEAGLKRECIILDPGVGFGKTVEQNLQLINRVDVFRETGYPVLIGTSRKSVIGHVLGLPVDKRVEGTAATVAVAITRGVDIVRVHDVKEIIRITKMTDAVVR